MDTNEVIQLELKYCERCGGLWLRRLGTDKIYCGRCSAEVPEFPIRRRAQSQPRLPGSVRKQEIRKRFELITGKPGAGL